MLDVRSLFRYIRRGLCPEPPTDEPKEETPAMALSATIDLTASPISLTVESTKRIVSVTVSSAGETATGTATYPITVTDDSGRAWTKESDDGLTARYTG